MPAVNSKMVAEPDLEAWSPYTSFTKTAAKPTLYGAGYTS